MAMEFIELTQNIGSGLPIIVGKGHIVKVFEVDQQRCRLSLTNGAEYEVLAEYKWLKDRLLAQ